MIICFSNNITVMLLLLIKTLTDMTKFFLFDELLESQIFFSWLIIYKNFLLLEGFPNHRQRL